MSDEPRFAPPLAVATAPLLALVSLGLVVLFIHHIASASRRTTSSTASPC